MRDRTGRDVDTYRSWVEYQFTPEMNLKKVDIDHGKSISSFHVPNNVETKGNFTWEKTLSHY